MEDAMSSPRLQRSCIGNLRVTHSAEYQLSGITLPAPKVRYPALLIGWDSECTQDAFRLPYQCRAHKYARGSETATRRKTIKLHFGPAEGSFANVLQE
ncbi:hypothetical protein BO83DRAFT_101292 [Aspergillus eucalypticola CBS 122712]|uniref:Uncharacterized protein n=1 Tax=Aspergillus eucalypticola (strain CBS 122712 / IBT 29274) TaxID=1448314 RepID=A0A317V5L1_ASPEC|nr:uncharacterized protein BO83DRAFT_101292 [Aspergillus eucalypticola CBS 122712]PWY67470.1 hypothetical protein BO83DRAFT_101292 [Aspergillus eucalypticola CBS 122712]